MPDDNMNNHSERRIILMTNFLKTYYWFVLVLAIPNLIGTLLLPFSSFDDPLYSYFMHVITILEIPLILLSLITIIYVIIEKKHDELFFPVFYVSVFSILIMWSLSIQSRGVSPLDFSVSENIMVFIASLIFYFSQSIWSYRFIFVKKETDMKKEDIVELEQQKLLEIYREKQILTKTKDAKSKFEPNKNKTHKIKKKR